MLVRASARIQAPIIHRRDEVALRRKMLRPVCVLLLPEVG
jgi:hypothetical protein